MTVAASPASSASASSSVVSAATSADEPPARPPRAGMCNDDGTLAKGAIRSAKLDLHGYARLMGDAFRKDVVVAGDAAAPGGTPCSGACLDIEDLATSFEQALALAGAPLAIRRGAAVISDRLKPSASPVAAASRAVDFDITRGDAVKMTSALGDVAKRTISGMPEGEITLLVRGRPALDLLALMADAAGTSTAARGTEVELAPGGLLPAAKPSLASEPSSGKGLDERWVAAQAHALESLQVAALFHAPSGALRAVVHSPSDPARSWVVKIGDEVGKARTVVDGGIERRLSARVERIHCLGVDFAFDEPQKSRVWLFLK